MTSPITFRSRAGFGKRIEYWIIGRMLMEGMDVYVPLVDDDAIDVVVRRNDGTFSLVQIKARSADAAPNNAARFSGIEHERRDDYWFVFYSECLGCMWIMTSEEFIEEASQNRTGKHAGKRSICFSGLRRNRLTGEREACYQDKWAKYRAEDFGRIRNPTQ